MVLVQRLTENINDVFALKEHNFTRKNIFKKNLFHVKSICIAYPICF